jgi:hypothetical protein
MSSSAQFRNLERDLKKQIEDIANKHIKDMVRKGQPHLDRVFYAFKGQPVETVIPHMRSALRQAGITPDNEAELRAFAQRVTDGTRTVLQASRDRMRW